MVIYRTLDEIKFLEGLHRKNRKAFANYADAVMSGQKRYDWTDDTHVSLTEVQEFIKRKQAEDRMDNHPAIKK